MRSEATKHCDYHMFALTPYKHTLVVPGGGLLPRL